MLINKRHHYIPVFLLNGFTRDNLKKRYLWIFDKKLETISENCPSNVAYQRDFYSVNIPEIKPDAIETCFSNRETKASLIIKKIFKTQRLPNRQKTNSLLSFLSLMAVRVPFHRKDIAKRFDQVGKDLLLMLAKDANTWEQTISTLKKSGYAFPSNINHEDIRNIALNNTDEFKLSQEAFIGLMIRQDRVIFPLLKKRKWSILIAKEGAGPFICSDMPLSLIGPDPYPRFDSPNTELTFPLNSRVALYSRFEFSLGTKEIDQKQVAIVNSHTYHFADRFIYSPTDDFPIIGHEDQIIHANELFEEYQDPMVLKRPIPLRDLKRMVLEC